MGILVDVVEPDRPDSPSDSEPEGLKHTLSSALVGVVAIAVLGVFAQLVIIGPSQRDQEFTEDSPSTAVDPNSDAFARGDEAPPRPDSLLTTEAGEELLIVHSDAAEPNSTATSLFVIKLRTGHRSRLPMPEPLLDREPVPISNGVVVIGSSGAWFGDRTESGFAWTLLGPADHLRPSTHHDRVWLRTDPAQPDSTQRFIWTEVDLGGQVTRSVVRNSELALPSPELTIGKGTGIFRLANKAELIDLGLPETETHWRPISTRGTVVAVGPNDLVASECATFLECDRVWYDPVTGNIRGGLFDDLADGISPRFMALLSPFGRFAASEVDDSQVELSSVATGAVIQNSCIWGQAMAWSQSEKLLACSTGDGIELYDMTTGRSLGLASPQTDPWVWAVFVGPNGDN